MAKVSTKKKWVEIFLFVTCNKNILWWTKKAIERGTIGKLHCTCWMSLLRYTFIQEIDYTNHVASPKTVRSPSNSTCILCDMRYEIWNAFILIENVYGKSSFEENGDESFVLFCVVPIWKCIWTVHGGKWSICAIICFFVVKIFSCAEDAIFFYKYKLFTSFGLSGSSSDTLYFSAAVYDHL